MTRDRARHQASMVYVLEIKAREKWKQNPELVIIRWSVEDEARAKQIGQKLVKKECEKTPEGKEFLEIYKKTLWELGYKNEARNLGFTE